MCDHHDWAQGIKQLSKIGVPMYITETGIADEKEDRRPEFFETYFAEVAPVSLHWLIMYGAHMTWSNLRGL